MQAYIFQAKISDKEKLEAKAVDVLAFICDQILSKFQSSLPFLAEFGKITVGKKEFTDFIEESILKNNFFGFDYLSDKNTGANKRKMISYYDVNQSYPETC